MPRSNYDEIADEYYSNKHETSRNFDATTMDAIRKRGINFTKGKVLELGAGKGRVGEFFNIHYSRVVQLDSSQAMFELNDREDCFLKILADACAIPLHSEQFTFVIGLLIDPFFGLDCASEAYRMLCPGGQLFITLPTYEWASCLREEIHIDEMTTRFRKIDTDEIVILPSLIHQKKRIEEILSVSGFNDIEISDHCLPEKTMPVSKDIIIAANKKGISEYQLPIIHSVSAKK